MIDSRFREKPYVWFSIRVMCLLYVICQYNTILFWTAEPLKQNVHGDGHVHFEFCLNFDIIWICPFQSVVEDRNKIIGSKYLLDLYFMTVQAMSALAWCCRTRFSIHNWNNIFTVDLLWWTFTRFSTLWITELLVWHAQHKVGNGVVYSNRWT